MTAPDVTHPFFQGFALDGTGGARTLGIDDLEKGEPERPCWLHFDCTNPGTREWMETKSGLDAIVIEALMAEETRPRCTPHEQGLLIVLRGVNLNPGADPEDMVSIRLWLEQDRLVSARVRPLMAVRDAVEALDEGRGPKSASGIIPYLVERLVHRMWSVVDDMNDSVDQFEETLIENTSPPAQLRRELGHLRRQAVVLRRFLSPQREALGRMQASDITIFSPIQTARLRESSDRITRIIEDLDEARERASLIQDELLTIAGERMNKTVYLLTLVATIMLPLGFLTGLLGINVGGIPGAENPAAFWAVAAGLALLVAIEVLIFKKLKWL